MASSRKTLVELKRDLDSTYCYPGIIDSRSLVDFGKDTETWFSSITDQLKCQKDELTANTFNSSKVKKEMLGKWLGRVVKLLERNEAIMMHLLGIVDKSKTDLIAAQQKVVKLQEELLVRKNEELKHCRQPLLQPCKTLCSMKFALTVKLLCQPQLKPLFARTI